MLTSSNKTPVFHSIYSTTSDLYKLHSASIIMNKNNKKYCLCIYLYSVGKRAVVSALLQSFSITFVITNLPTVSSLVFISSHTVLGLLNQMKELKFKDCVKELFPPLFIFLFVSLLFFFKRDLHFKGKYSFTDRCCLLGRVKKKNEGRSLCKVFLIRKKKPYMQTF